MGLGEMADSVCESETASCTAITEKRHGQKTGGCTGILFRLIDWNRRFTKKQLFSRKLLPPAHQAKHTAKKFKGDEKMPTAKLHQIADENKGGFPKLKKNARGTDIVQKEEMRAPCLVARLMGLEPMPAVHRDKNKKPSSSASLNDQKHEFVAASTGEYGNGESLHMEDGQLKHESRPQKLQKTGQSSERRQAMARFTHEGMHFKGVLSRNRKHHHPKLATPVKSPGVSSARTATGVSRSRLIDAATKILEPRLVAKNKYRNALSYPRDTTQTCPDKVMLVGSRVCLEDGANQSDYNTASAKQFSGQTACRNCGCLLENADFRPIAAAKLSDCSASSLALADAPDQSGATPPQPSPSPCKQLKKVSCMASQENALSLAARLRNDPMEHRGVLGRKIPVSQKTKEHEGRTQGSLNKKSSFIASKHGTMRDRWHASAEERMPPAKVCSFHKRRMTSAPDSVDGAKGFIGFNCRPTGQGHEMASAVPKASNVDAYAARISCAEQVDSSSHLRTHVQKRRFINVERHVERPSFASSTSRTEWNPVCPFTEGEKGPGVHYYNDTLIERSENQTKGTASNHSGVNRAAFLACTSSSTHMDAFGCSSDVAGSFSKCSCISSNLGDPSGFKMHRDFASKTCDHPRSFGFGQLNEQEGLHRSKMTNLYARTSKDFCHFGVARASRYKLNQAQIIAMDAEPVFIDSHSFSTCCVIDFRVIFPLLNKLEKSAGSSLSSITAVMGLATENSRNQLREFLLDCLLEFLDSRFYWHHEVCCLWRKLPLPMDLDTLIHDVEDEVRSWVGLPDMSIDEIIKWEMGHSFKEWTDFRNEALENGIKIDSNIFQTLVDELVEDLYGACRQQSSF